MNAEPPAQLPPVGIRLRRKPNKFPSLVHDRHLAPWHGWPPCSLVHAYDDVSAMSPNTRRVCLRAVHLFRPSTTLTHNNKQDVDARQIRAFTPVFDGLWPGMTEIAYAAF